MNVQAVLSCCISLLILISQATFACEAELTRSPHLPAASRRYIFTDRLIAGLRRLNMPTRDLDQLIRSQPYLPIVGKERSFSMVVFVPGWDRSYVLNGHLKGDDFNVETIRKGEWMGRQSKLIPTATIA